MKPVIVMGRNRSLISTIILDKLEGLLSGMAIDDLHSYGEITPEEEAVSSLILWPSKGGLANTLQLVMAGQPENDKYAIDELVHNVLQWIASNWRR